MDVKCESVAVVGDRGDTENWRETSFFVETDH